MLPPKSFAARAAEIRRKTAALDDAPMLTRIKLGQEIANEVTNLVADMAVHIDHYSPYLDEADDVRLKFEEESG